VGIEVGSSDGIAELKAEGTCDREGFELGELLSSFVGIEVGNLLGKLLRDTLGSELLTILGWYVGTDDREGVVDKDCFKLGMMLGVGEGVEPGAMVYRSIPPNGT